MRHHAEALAARFPPLMVAARRVAQTVAQGLHGRRQAGMGETFWQFRHYQSFDSVRRIDWRRSARSRTVFVRETEWEAAQSVWIWRDPSPSMAWRSGRALPEKRERAELLALALAALLTDGGVIFHLNFEVGRDATLAELRERHRGGRAAMSTEQNNGMKPAVPPKRSLLSDRRVRLLLSLL